MKPFLLICAPCLALGFAAGYLGSVFMPESAAILPQLAHPIPASAHLTSSLTTEAVSPSETNAPLPSGPSALVQVAAEADQNLITAWDRAQAIPDPQLRLDAMKVVFRNAAINNSALGLQWLKQHPEAATQDSVNALTRALPLTDLKSSMDWLASVPDANWQPAMQILVGRLVMQNPAQAAALLKSNSDNPILYDPMAAAFAQAVGPRDPHTALQWAQTIGNSAQRQGAERGVFENWASTDPIAAQAWLRQATQEATANSTQAHDLSLIQISGE